MKDLFKETLESMKLTNEKVGLSNQGNVDKNWKFYHVSQQAYRRYHILTGNTAWFYHSLMESSCSKYGVLIICQMIMSNHIHEILYTEDVGNISKLKAMVGSRTSISMNKSRLEIKKKPFDHLFSGRPGFVPIRNRVQLLITLKYIWDNDLELRKHGEKASFSSFEGWNSSSSRNKGAELAASLFKMNLSSLFELLEKDKKEVLRFANLYKAEKYEAEDFALFHK